MKRLRYSVPDEQWALLEEAAKVLSVDPKVVLQLSTAIGLRFLDYSVIHPMNLNIAKAVDDRAAQGAAAIMSDFSKAAGLVPESKKESSSSNAKSAATPKSKKIKARAPN